MLHTHQHENARERFVFQSAFPDVYRKNKPNENEYHPALDRDFLVRLDAEQITDKERTELLEHLAECPFCRDEIADYIRTGILYEEAEPVQEQEKHLQSQSRSTSSYSNTCKFRLTIFVASATVLLVLLGIFLVESMRPDPAVIARKNLADVYTEDDQKTPDCLADFGYTLSGNPIIKSISVEDPHSKKLRTAFEMALDIEPDNKDIRLNYARYLLFIAKDLQAANTVLLPLCNDEAAGSEVHLLAGTIAFENNDDQKAVLCFRNGLKKDPTNYRIQMNLAIALYRSGNSQEAVDNFKKLRENPDAKQYYSKIDKFLKKQLQKKDQPSSDKDKE